VNAPVSSAAAILLGVACTVWSAVPTVHKGLAVFVLVIAICWVAASAVRLLTASVPLPEDSYLLPALLRAWLNFLTAIRFPPWEEGAVIAIIWLEVIHPARPRHTAVLGVALLAYLLAVHLAESGASPGVLRPQVPVLAIGICLLALGAGAGMLPEVTPGAGGTLLRLVAAVAVIAAAGLVLPFVRTGRDS
jgi:hypothetical protein